MNKILKIILIIFIVILFAVLGVFIYSEGHSEVIGENDLGSVNKVTYGHSSNPSVEIGIVSGMHSRELNHKFVLPLV